MLRFVLASVLAIITSAGSSGSIVNEICTATEGSHSTRRMAMLQVASRVSHREVISDLDEGNVDHSSSNVLSLVPIAVKVNEIPLQELQSASMLDRMVTSNLIEGNIDQSRSTDLSLAPLTVKVNELPLQEFQSDSTLGHRAFIYDPDEGNSDQSRSNDLSLTTLAVKVNELPRQEFQSVVNYGMVPSMLGHGVVTSGLDEGEHGQSNSSQAPIVAVGGSGVVLTASVMNGDNATTSVMNGDNATRASSFDQLPLISVAADSAPRVNATDRENSSLAEQEATAASMNNSVEPAHVKAESEKEAAERTRRNVFMAVGSVVLPVCFLLWGHQHQTECDEDDYCGGPTAARTW